LHLGKVIGDDATGQARRYGNDEIAGPRAEKGI
jgi:hypothetical protein